MLITKPTLLIDEVKAKQNIQFMNEKAKSNKVDFRPHFKTHFSAEIGKWYQEVGINKITVSSIDMAVYFANHGWKDITIAFPVNILEINTLNDLASKIRLNLVVESLESVAFLNQQMNSPVNIWVKVDTGNRRTGICWENSQVVKEVVLAMKEPLVFYGLLAHFGHTYKERNLSTIQKIYDDGVARLAGLKSELSLKDCWLSIGDTPSCSLVEDFGDIDEIRPGNFVFYDLMQEQIGACSIGQISVCMACPVVAIHPERNEIVIHGGAVHFSKDVILDNRNRPIYGRVVSLHKSGWENTLQNNVILKFLSQEHGIISAPNEFISHVKVGDLLGVLPVHSCLTANLMKDYRTLDGHRLPYEG